MATCTFFEQWSRVKGKREQHEGFLPPLSAVISRRVPPAMVIEQTAKVLGLTKESILTPNKKPAVVRRRQVLAYVLSRVFPDASYPDIGRVLRQHHTTVMHAIRNVEEALKTDAELQAVVKQIEEAI